MVILNLVFIPTKKLMMMKTAADFKADQMFVVHFVV